MPTGSTSLQGEAFLTGPFPCPRGREAGRLGSILLQGERCVHGLDLSKVS